MSVEGEIPTTVAGRNFIVCGTETSSALSENTRAPGQFYALRGQRLFDILVVLAMAPALLLPIAVICAVLKAGGGPVFYCHSRVGRGGETFGLWKFRTMVPESELGIADILQRDPGRAREWRLYRKFHDDPRVTRLGRILRRTSLDELPQVVNVLAGHMSLVGPRPFTREEEPPYRAAGGRAYFQMRPGLTGPWQLQGRGGTCVTARVVYDEGYFRSRSLRRDVAILLRTFGVVFKGR